MLGVSTFEYASVSGMEFLVEVKAARLASGAEAVPDEWRRVGATKQVVRFR